MTIAADFAVLSQMLLQASIMAQKLQVAIESGAALTMVEGAPPEPPAPLAKYTLNGARRTIAELADLAGCSRTVMHRRLTGDGMAPEEAVAVGAKRHSPGTTYRIDGEHRTCRELADLAGCSVEAMKGRLRRMNPTEAVALGATPARGPASRWKLQKMPADAPTPVELALEPLLRAIAPVPPTPAPAPKPALLEPIVPADFEPIVPQAREPAPVPSTFGRIGEYEETGSAIERAARERGR